MKKKIIILVCLTFVTFKINAQIVKIHDANFKKALIEFGVDKNKDGQISFEEAKLIDSLKLDDKGIRNMAGIENFTALNYLSCDKNKLKKIDISKNILLEKFSCENNMIKSLNISKNQELEGLFIRNNKIKTINLSENPKLGFLDCGINKLKNLDIRKNREPFFLGCDKNPQLLKVCITFKQLEFFKRVGISYQKDNFTDWSMLCD
jgi:hypothetical protein